MYLPDDLYDELKRRDLPASELLQVAVRAELERRDVLEATADYLTELAAEIGGPTRRQQSRADAIVRRIRDRQLHQTGWPVLVIDSGGVSRLAEHSTRALALIRALRDDGLRPPIAPTVVLVESLQGHSGRDATTNRFLKTCVAHAHHVTVGTI